MTVSAMTLAALITWSRAVQREPGIHRTELTR
jgi:hypothetical protein